MATRGLLGGFASGLSLRAVGIVDGIGIADGELLLTDECWHCLSVVLETRCGVVGCTGASVVESGLYSGMSTGGTVWC